MQRYLYLSLAPESLIVSMLPPEEFGAYLATGTRKRPHGQAMFFQLKPDFESDYFDLSNIDKRCVPHADGQPKHSVYLAIYRVLEHVGLDAIESLFLATAHGRVLEIQPGPVPPDPAGGYHLYQEICPVHPLIASSLAIDEFRRFITDTSTPVSVPRICFVELDLAELAADPLHGSATNLPYHNIRHLRDCLAELGPHTGKQAKTVDRTARQGVLYRCVKTGFCLGDQDGVLCFPYPSKEELLGKYYTWWRCANDVEIERDGATI